MGFYKNFFIASLSVNQEQNVKPTSVKVILQSVRVERGSAD